MNEIKKKMKISTVRILNLKEKMSKFFENKIFTNIKALCWNISLILIRWGIYFLVHCCKLGLDHYFQ